MFYVLIVNLRIFYLKLVLVYSKNLLVYPKIVSKWFVKNIGFLKTFLKFHSAFLIFFLKWTTSHSRERQRKSLTREGTLFSKPHAPLMHNVHSTSYQVSQKRVPHADISERVASYQGLLRSLSAGDLATLTPPPQTEILQP